MHGAVGFGKDALAGGLNGEPRLFSDLRREIHVGSYQRLFAVIQSGERRKHLLCGGHVLLAAHAEHIAPESAVIVAGGKSGAGKHRAERALIAGGILARKTLFAGGHGGGDILRPLHASLYFK